MKPLTPAQIRMLHDVNHMVQRPGGYLGMYEPNSTWAALEKRGLVVRDGGGRLTLYGRYYIGRAGVTRDA
jgi:hypothetical protein